MLHTGSNLSFPVSSSQSSNAHLFSLININLPHQNKEQTLDRTTCAYTNTANTKQKKGSPQDQLPSDTLITELNHYNVASKTTKQLDVDSFILNNFICFYNKYNLLYMRVQRRKSFRD